MHRLRALSRGVQVLLALAVGGALFGIATAVQADIPDSGWLHFTSARGHPARVP